MRIFAISDIHIDFEDNRRWLENLSRYDYQEDLLILAGDVTDIIPMFAQVLMNLKDRFAEVLYIPGNHDLWVYRQPQMNSLEKLVVRIKILYHIYRIFGKTGQHPGFLAAQLIRCD